MLAYIYQVKLGSVLLYNTSLISLWTEWYNVVTVVQVRPKRDEVLRHNKSPADQLRCAGLSLFLRILAHSCISGKSGGRAPPDFEIENQFVYFVRLRSDRNLDIFIIILFLIISTAKMNNSITVILSLRFLCYPLFVLYNILP